jgi:hypothetical protein
MPIPVVIAALIKTLAANGLSTLASAVQAKGKEWVEDKIGVKLPDDPAGVTGDKLVELKKAEMQHEEVLVQASTQLEIAATQAVTERWKADMASDSWLSKNIRPLTLIFILSVYTIFALLSAFEINVNKSYVELLGQWGIIIMSAYFIGRSVEKGLSIRKGKNGTE